MIQSYSSKNIKHHRNIVILMVASPLLVIFMLAATFYASLNFKRDVNAASTLIFDGSKTSNWSGKQLGSGCGSSLKDTSNVPSGLSGTSVEVVLADGCKWSGDGTNSRERAELVMPVDKLSFKEGTVWYIDFWQRFDQLPNTMNSDWDIWMQTHYEGGGQPNLIFASDQGRQMEFKTSQGCSHTLQWKGPNIETGKWYHFTLGAKFSADKTAGWVELYFNGTNVVPKKNVATLTGSNVQCSAGQNSFNGTHGYLKKGVYRNGSFSGNEKYTMYGLKIYGSNPLTNSSTTPAPAPSPAPVPSPPPSLTPQPLPAPPELIETPAIEVPGANPETPVEIPKELAKSSDGTIVADFNGDGTNDEAKDSNLDGKIDPSTEIIINSADFNEDHYKPNAGQSSIMIGAKMSDNTVTIKPGPLPEVRIAKPIAYTFLITQGAAFSGISVYLAITKLSIFAGIKTRWHL